MKVNGKDYPIYYGNQNMFETTNQCCDQESSQISFDVPPQTFVDIDQSASDAQLGFSVFRQCLASYDRRLCNAYPLVDKLT